MDQRATKRGGDRRWREGKGEQIILIITELEI